MDQHGQRAAHAPALVVSIEGECEKSVMVVAVLTCASAPEIRFSRGHSETLYCNLDHSYRFRCTVTVDMKRRQHYRSSVAAKTEGLAPQRCRCHDAVMPR